jgi:hypothetical protein
MKLNPVARVKSRRLLKRCDYFNVIRFKKAHRRP